MGVGTPRLLPNRVGVYGCLSRLEISVTMIPNAKLQNFSFVRIGSLWGSILCIFWVLQMWQSFTQKACLIECDIFIFIFCFLGPCDTHKRHFKHTWTLKCSIPYPSPTRRPLNGSQFFVLWLEVSRAYELPLHESSSLPLVLFQWMVLFTFYNHRFPLHVQIFFNPSSEREPVVRNCNSCSAWPPTYHAPSFKNAGRLTPSNR